MRKSRGWVFTEGVDDIESECGLDQDGSFMWDFFMHNIDSSAAENILKTLVDLLTIYI